MSELLATSAYARKRGISEQRVRQLLAAGKVAGAIRVGSRWVIPSDAVIERVSGGRPPSTRSGLLRQAARACLNALSGHGVRALVVGSVAYGGTVPESDLDLLVLSHPGRTWGQVRAIADAAARPFGVPVDLIYADTLSAAARKALLKDARNAGEL